MALSIQMLDNAEEDIGHIEDVSTSTLPTATDRLGNEKMTVAGAVATIAAVNNRGAWASGTAYALKDLVSSGGAWYFCVQAHTSAASFATDAAKWRVYQGTVPSEVPYTVATYSALRSYAGDAFAVNVSGYLVTAAPAGIAGLFTRDDADTTSADNGGTIIVASDGTRWKRVFGSQVNAAWFGAKGDSSGATGDGTDNAAAFEAAMAVAFPDNDHPKTLVVPEGYYRVTESLTAPAANWCIVGENNRVIIWCDHEDVGLDVPSGTGAFHIEGIDIRRVSGKSGTGMRVYAPEGSFRRVKIFNHSTGLEMKDAHLSKLHDVYISGCSTVGLSDLGRCFGSSLIDCNIIANNDGAVLRSNWTIVGGAIEQNDDNDLDVGVTAAHDGTHFGFVKAIGVHFEAKSGDASATSSMVRVGPTGSAPANDRQGFVAIGCYFVGNSSARKAIENRQGKVLQLTGCEFFGYSAGATLISCDAFSRGVRFNGNHWDGTGTFKSVNTGCVDVIDMDVDSATLGANGVVLRHGSGGGSLTGIQRLESAPRSDFLQLNAMRNSAGVAIDVRTPGADHATLFSRIQCTSGADLGVVSFPSAKVEVAGSFTAPFKLGTAYLWINSGKLYIKDGSVPASATDGTVVGAQS